MTYFEIFEIQPRLSLDPASLQRRFYELSRRYHPDRSSGSTDQSALLNDAFRTLRDPVARAEYVLRLHGFDLNSRDVPPDLLEEVFEFNVAVEESDSAQLDHFRERFSSMLGEIDSSLESAFSHWDSSRSQEILDQIRSLLNRRKYIHNLVRTIHDEHVSN